MRDRIKAAATDMFIERGYNGVSFLDIGKALGITHSNIHYHFKNKASLALEVVQDYAARTLSAYAGVWKDPSSSLHDKIVGSRDWAFSQYCSYNPEGRGGASWGLLARFSIDADALDVTIRRELVKTFRELDGYVEQGVRNAVTKGELAPGAPVEDIMLQITCVLYSSRQVTRYDASFDRLDALFRSTIDLLERAYGSSGGVTAPWPEVALPARLKPAAAARSAAQ